MIAKRHDPQPVRDPYHGIFSYGVETAADVRLLHVSGQVGESPKGHLPEDFRGQCEQALRNVEAVLQSADMQLSNIIKMNFYLTQPKDMATLVDVRKEMLDGVRPAITTLFVSGLVSPDWLIEVEAVAAAK